MNEADTRAEKIDPKLKASGWGVVKDSLIRREYFTNKDDPFKNNKKRKKADYVLIFKNRKLAVVEAKSDEEDVSEGISQAKDYAERLKLLNAFSTNGNEIHEIKYSKDNEGELIINSEKKIPEFPTPKQLWDRTFKNKNEWSNKFDNQPYFAFKGNKEPRYYQDVAITSVLDAIAENKKRILLNLATGTGKTVIAFQIAWKLFNSNWNNQNNINRKPRILFLADRNILANQAYNSFNGFPENALSRITTKDIKKLGKVPTSSSIYFTIFQTFMSGPNETPYFGDYPKDFFDLIIIDECHRGGANDESSWRKILEYFSNAVQIGLTATPKRNNNADTYDYFGKPIYKYSLKEGIEDEFLCPFRVERTQTTIDEYTFLGDDRIIEGEDEIEDGDIFREGDFNRIIEIREREKKRVQLLLDKINLNEKTLIFCASIRHAGIVRDIINELIKNKKAGFCERVTSKDGEIGEMHLRHFQDNEKLIPTILTTSRKLNTGVDARNIRNIALMRPVNNIIEFKQIIGRGTRLYNEKKYFTIIDFVGAIENFQDPEWDGDPIKTNITKNENHEYEKIIGDKIDEQNDDNNEKDNRKMIVVQLAEGRELEIKSMSTSLFYFNGKNIPASEFIKNLFNTISLPTFFKDEEELKRIWSSPLTRKELLKKLEKNSFSKEKLLEIQQIINAEESDLFDVLEYVAYKVKPISRIERASKAEALLSNKLDNNQKEFINFVLSRYIEGGVDELEIEKLSQLLKLKYNEIYDAEKNLGDIESIKETFVNFQKYLYE